MAGPGGAFARERLFVVLSVVVGSLLALAAVEGGLRVAGEGREPATSVVRRVSADRRVALDLYSENPWGELDIDLRVAEVRERYVAQGLTALDEVAGVTPYGVECRYDELGFRAPRLARRREGITRILVLGDSFTEGQGVRADAAYPSVLARAIERVAPGRFEVGNRGHRGWDFPYLGEAFHGLTIEEPDVVIYGMVLNDVERTPEFQARQAYLNDWIIDRGTQASVADVGVLRHLRLVSFVRQRLARWRVSRATTRWYRDMYGPDNARGWKRTERELRRMGAEMRRRGGVLIVALWPLLVDLEGRYPFEAPTEAVARCCREAGIPFVDLREALRGRPTGALWVTRADHHPNELAHRLVGEALLSRVLAAVQSIQPPPRHSSPS